MAFAALPRPPSVETETRLVLPDDADAVLGPGDVQLAGGVGLTFRRSSTDPTGRAIGDAPTTAMLRPVSAFLPGALAAQIYHRLPVGGDVTSYLRELHAYALTPPSGGTDGSNCWGIRVAGATSGAQILRLDTDAEPSYSFDAAGEVPVLGGEDTYGNEMANMRAWVTKWVATANHTVTGITVYLYNNQGGSIAAGTPVRLVLLDSNLNVLREKFVDTGVPMGSLLSVAWDQSIDIAQNDTVWFGVQVPQGQEFETEQATEASEVGGTADGTHRRIFRDDPGNIEDPGDGSETVARHYDPATGRPMRAWLTGNPGGVALTGDVTVEAVSFGVPPSAPADVNVTLAYAEEDLDA